MSRYYRVLTGNTSMRDPVFQKLKLAPIEYLHDHWKLKHTLFPMFSLSSYRKPEIRLV